MRGNPHNARVDIRATKEEVDEWKKVAAHKRVSVAAWIRAELNESARRYVENFQQAPLSDLSEALRNNI